METWIGVIGILIGVIIAIVPIIWKKYFSRPEMTIEFIKNGGLSSPRGYSIKNKLTKEGYIDGSKAICIFELIWKFKIRITNNSDQVAYYTQLDFNPNGPKVVLITNLNSFQPIKSAESVDFELEYRKYEEKLGNERTDLSKVSPIEFDDLGVLLSYQNSHKTNFYTLYNFTDNKNIFLRKKPTEYK